MGIVFRAFPTLWLFSINTMSSWPSSHPPPQLLHHSPQPLGFQRRVCFSSIAPEECLVVLCVTLGECLIMLSVTRCGRAWAERRGTLIPLCFVLCCTALVFAGHFTLELWRNSWSCCWVRGLWDVRVSQLCAYAQKKKQVRATYTCISRQEESRTPTGCAKTVFSHISSWFAFSRQRAQNMPWTSS